MKKQQTKQYKTENKILTIVAALLLVGATATVTAGICTDWFSRNPFEQAEKDSTKDDVETSIKENGVSLKLLSTSTTSEGYVVKTFTFGVEPANATDQTVSATAKYKDGSDCSAVMSVTVNNSAKTIALTCKAAFSKQIIVTVTSNANSSAKATINLDYVKKLLSINKKNVTIDIGANFPGITFNNSFAIDQMITPSYSLYTKDKTYTFNVKDVTVDVDEMIYDGSDLNLGLDTEVLYREYLTPVMDLLQTKIQNKAAAPTKEEIWNAVDDNTWHSLLKGYEKQVKQNNYSEYLCSFTLNATYYCVEDPSKELVLNPDYIGFYPAYDWTGFSVNVDKITVETPNIEF